MPNIRDPRFRFTILAAFTTVLGILGPMGLSFFGLALNYFSSVPLFMVGLSLGPHYLIYGVTLTVILVALFVGLIPALAFIAIQALPMWFIIKWALSKTPATTIMTRLTTLLLALFTFVVFAFPLITEQFLQTWLGKILKLDPVGQVLGTQTLPFIPSLIIISWLLMMIFNTILAQRLLQTRKLNLRTYPAKHDHTPPQHWDIVFLAALLITLLNKEGIFHFWALNVLIISCVPLILVGLRIFYLWLMQFPVAKLWFFVMLFIMFVFMWPLMILIGLGILEPVLKLYPRLKK